MLTQPQADETTIEKTQALILRRVEQPNGLKGALSKAIYENQKDLAKVSTTVRRDFVQILALERLERYI